MLPPHSQLGCAKKKWKGENKWKKKVKDCGQLFREQNMTRCQIVAVFFFFIINLISPILKTCSDSLSSILSLFYWTFNTDIHYNKYIYFGN